MKVAICFVGCVLFEVRTEHQRALNSSARRSQLLQQGCKVDLKCLAATKPRLQRIRRTQVFLLLEHNFVLSKLFQGELLELGVGIEHGLVAGNRRFGAVVDVSLSEKATFFEHGSLRMRSANLNTVLVVRRFAKTRFHTPQLRRFLKIQFILKN